MNYPRSLDRWVSNPINRLIISNKVLYQDSWLRRRFPPFSGLTGNFIWKGYLTWLSLIMLPRIHIVLFMKSVNYISPFIPLAKASGFSGEKLIKRTIFIYQFYIPLYRKFVRSQDLKFLRVRFYIYGEFYHFKGDRDTGGR